MDINNRRGHPHRNRNGLHRPHVRDANSQTHLHAISDVHAPTEPDGNATSNEHAPTEPDETAPVQKPANNHAGRNTTDATEPTADPSMGSPEQSYTGRKSPVANNGTQQLQKRIRD